MDNTPHRSGGEATVAAYALGHSERELERLIAQGQRYEPFTAHLFREAGITPGMRVLDVGCGAGDVSFLAARMVGPTGQVIGVDRAPAAVAMARRRALALGVSNTRFVEGDASALTFSEPCEELFDAAVGRLVLEFSGDPVALLRSVAAHVRPGGVIAFQEVDWSGDRASSPVPTFSRCLRWGVDALQRSGADPYIGLKLFTLFTAAGLPPPALSLHASVGAGPDHPVYAAFADFMRTLLPRIVAQAVATADEVDIDSLASRISAEAVATGATVVWMSVIGAASRKAAEQ
jgi:ubiquinone/menaquinone biosynthesis C-methylase UbiE